MPVRRRPPSPVLVRTALVLGILGASLLRVEAAAARGYEVWASDQSNSRPDVSAPGIRGSWLWIWDSDEIRRQLRSGRTARPLRCDGSNQAGEGPCDLYEVFPTDLEEVGADGRKTGLTLEQAPGFGRLHGMLPDPQNRYMNVNLFAPKGGYIGIIDGRSKEAVALFRVPATSSGRSVHMSFWNSDGSALLVANLHGKVLHRIDVQRDSSGTIRAVEFNRTASLGVGKDLRITEPPTVYLGSNALVRPLLGRIVGSPDPDAIGDLTPQGFCKENGCSAGRNAADGGRPNNLIICPIVSRSDKAYVTLAGGGLIVADTRSTPMRILADYDQATINGAGCGGVQTGSSMWLNAGVSASGAGADQSTFTLYRLDDAALGRSGGVNVPAPTVVFRDPTNTATIGNPGGEASNPSGQLPNTTTRRDSHGMAATTDGRYVHTVDRILNNVEVIEVASGRRTSYDLTSADGMGRGTGACAASSVSDDPGLPANDPAPDLVEATPDGRHLMVALRGPLPVSVMHSAQGSCPGVGIIELTRGGASGRLAGVLRTTNTIDTASGDVPGGHPYSGRERSDIHGAGVRRR